MYFLYLLTAVYDAWSRRRDLSTRVVVPRAVRGAQRTASDVQTKISQCVRCGAGCAAGKSMTVLILEIASPGEGDPETTQIRPLYQVLLGFLGELSSCHAHVTS